ncbi:hypothetical protein WR164_01580 [Philodulcilactobacillus myokoensis]|uniref:Uncharacterized protein n=1 Tax=Philodulcilactobacillus myokoensis TaxID=2929573 RepID=A0A9W6ESI5_9LACO|nr:hypothetical protein [Philodulcilactobacillus myokoensis]GLB46179.1 hypothetical protein WR164_01580 [Philodulcilactobacillus myokoensis]
MLIKRKFAIAFASLALVLPIGIGNVNQQAHASYAGHHASPTEIRGTWYVDSKSHSKFASFPIKYTKDTLLVDKVPFLSTKYSDCEGEVAHIYRFPKSKTGFAGTVYTMTKVKSIKNITNDSVFWLSHRKINGHRVLMEIDVNKSNHKHFSADFEIMTRNKIYHNYSFTYHGTYANAKKLIGK